MVTYNGKKYNNLKEALDEKRGRKEKSKKKVLDKLNRKIAKAGIGLQFDTSPSKKSPTVAACATKSEPVNLLDLPRSVLMRRAQEKGIKNFRVMNKEELCEVLDDPKRIPAITEQAVTRWKKGWGTRGKK